MTERWDGGLSEESFVLADDSADQFGVPPNIMGRHPEDFFSMLGRIVALAATLENKILDFYQDLMGSRQDEHTGLSVSQLITNALKELHRLPLALADRALAERFLLEAKAITERRNDYVHNLWPAQGDGHLFGWRAVSKKKVDTASVTMRGSLVEMQADLDRLVAILETPYLMRIRGLVSGRQHLMHQG